MHEKTIALEVKLSMIIFVPVVFYKIFCMQAFEIYQLKILKHVFLIVYRKNLLRP